MCEHIVVSIIPRSQNKCKGIRQTAGEKEGAILVILPKKASFCQMPVRSKLGVYSSLALLFCCM